MDGHGVENILGDLFAKALLRKVLEKEDKDQPFATVSSVNTASKARILTVVDKLLKNKQPPDTKSQPVPQGNIPIPWQEKWDFKMGDKVRVNRGLSDFKSISRRTVGWQPRYERVLTKVGVITSICSRYDCHVQVLFPELPVLAEIYAGLLSKTRDSPEGAGLTRFQPGETVMVKAHKSLVALLQNGYESLPKEFLGKVGRVIAVDCEKTAHLSFTGTFTVKVNPALLQKEKGEIGVDSFENPKDIAVDDEVVVTKSLKKFVEAQKKIHDWERWMSKLPGKTLRVLLVKEGGLLRVCDKAGRSFNIHTDVVLRKGTEPEDDKSDGDTYEVGEWVALKKIQNISKIMEDKGVPISFLEYLQQPARVMGYNEDLKPGITFDSIYTITVPPSALEKITDADLRKAEGIEKAAGGLTLGDEVVLNLGPPNYLRDILREQEFDESDIRLVTFKARLRGFIGHKRALIECSDGSLRKINRFDITVPEKFGSPVKGKLSCEMALTQDVVLAVEKCLERFNEEKTSGTLEIEAGIKSMYVENGEPSTLRIGIRTHLADVANLRDALLKSPSMRFEALSDDLLRVQGTEGSHADLLVRLDFDCLVAPKPPMPSIQAWFDGKHTGESLTNKLHLAECGNEAEAKSTPGTQQEQVTSCDTLAGYQHLEMNFGGMRIQIPYRIPEAQQPNPNDAQNRRGEPLGAALSRITINGDIRDVHISAF